jgi:hypothetical protein
LRPAEGFGEQGWKAGTVSCLSLNKGYWRYRTDLSNFVEGWKGYSEARFADAAVVVDIVVDIVVAAAAVAAVAGDYAGPDRRCLGMSLCCC